MEIIKPINGAYPLGIWGSWKSHLLLDWIKSNPLTHIFSQSTKKFFELDRRYALITFRLVILLLVLFFTLYGVETNLTVLAVSVPIKGLLLLSLGQFLSNALLLFFPKRFMGKKMVGTFFFVDILYISLAVYWTQGFESDLFLIYFLVVFMTAVTRKTSITFLVAGVACLLYSALFLKTNPVTDFLQPFVIIRFPLLMVGAFFSSLIVHELKAQEELIDNISHELRAPLASIQVASKILLDEFKKDGKAINEEDHLRILSIISRSSKKIITMVDDILDLFRYEMGKIVLHKTQLSVSKMIEETVEEFSISCSEKNLVLQDAVEQNLPTISADAVKIRQALINLLGNAMKFTPSGGTIILGARKTDHPTKKIELYVKDTGIGINQEQKNKIFNKFYQVNEVIYSGKSGLGLGLSLVQSIVEAHNGEIVLQSETGKGSTFSMIFPIHAEQSENKKNTLDKRVEENCQI